MSVSDSSSPAEASAAPPSKGRLRLPPRRVLDAVLVTLILAVGAWWGTRFERAWRADGQASHFYQSYFEPAVMLACGRGFVVADPRTQVPGLQAFLDQETDRFSCAGIPADLRVETRGLYQEAWYYLMMAVGTTWRVVGVSWSGLAPLFGLLYGSVLVIAFGLFRFGMGRPLALVATFALAVSSLHLYNLPHLRDYAKAPFVLALILLMAWTVRGEPTRRRILGLAAASGAVLGVGYGFRTDLLANIPPLFVTLVAFLPGGIRAHLWLKAQAVAVCVAVFLTVSWPVVNYVADRGGCQWHVTLLGFSSYFDNALGIQPASYDWGPYSDAYLHTAVGAFYRPGADAAAGPAFCTPEYDAMTARYLTAVGLTFPGDIATRAVASMVGVLELPSIWFRPPLPSYDNGFYAWRADFLQDRAGWGPIMAVVLVLATAGANLRIALWGLFILLWFGSLPMLQFHYRHHFHLEWMAWFAAGTLASGAGRALVGLTARGLGRAHMADSRSWLERATGVLVIAACCALVAVAVFVARDVQESRVRALVEELRRWTAQPVQIVRAPAIDDQVTLHLQLPGWSLEEPDARFQVEYLRIDVDPERCGPDGSVTVRYAPPHDDLNRTWRIHPGQASVLTPVFRLFQDLTVPVDGCVRAVYRAPNFKPLPAWMYVEVPANLDDLRAVQSYSGLRRLWPVGAHTQRIDESPIRASIEETAWIAASSRPAKETLP